MKKRSAAPCVFHNIGNCSFRVVFGKTLICSQCVGVEVVKIISTLGKVAILDVFSKVTKVILADCPGAEVSFAEMET